jgi:hypothetical protein
MPRLPPLRLTLAEPAAAVMVDTPQDPLRPFGVATTNPAGKASVKAMPFKPTVFAAGLLMVKLSEVVPFTGMPPAPKALLIEGGPTTLMLAEAAAPDPSSTELMVLVVSI